MTQVEDEALPNVGVWGLCQDGRQRSISLELLDDACVPPTPASANSSGSRPAPASLLEEKRYPFQRGRKVSQSSIGSPGADPETRNPVPVVYVGADPRKRQWRSGRQDRRRKGFGQGQISKWITTVVTGASAWNRTCPREGRIFWSPSLFTPGPRIWGWGGGGMWPLSPRRSLPVENQKRAVLCWGLV